MPPSKSGDRVGFHLSSFMMGTSIQGGSIQVHRVRRGTANNGFGVGVSKFTSLTKGKCYFCPFASKSKEERSEEGRSGEVSR